MKTEEWGEVPSRTILDCESCETVVTAPMEDGDGILLCPDCGDDLIVGDYVEVDDVFALIKRVREQARAQMALDLGH